MKQGVGKFLTIVTQWSGQQGKQGVCSPSVLGDDVGGGTAKDAPWEVWSAKEEHSHMECGTGAAYPGSCWNGIQHIFNNIKYSQNIEESIHSLQTIVPDI